MLVDLALVTLIAVFICFWRLGSSSLTGADEINGVQRALETIQSDNWFVPKFGGEPALEKPAFKMWLMAAPLSLISEPNLAFRFLDAAAGVLSLLLLFFFAVQLMNSRLVGYLALLSFIGCDIFVGYHGLRNAVHDSLLMMFTLAALFAGWKIVVAPSGERSAAWPLIGGLAVGFAVLVKSAGGLIALFIVAAYCILSARRYELFRERWKDALVVLALAGAVSLAYYLPLCLMEDKAFFSFFYHNVYERVWRGYHSVEGPWFYLVRIFEQRGAVVPELLAASLFYGLWRWRANGEDAEASLFLLCWSLVPLVLYSIADTKLSWYIAPALPGMSMLIAAMCAALFTLTCKRLVQWWHGSARRSLATAGLAAVSTAALVLLAANVLKIISLFAEEKPRLELDLVVEEIMHSQSALGRSPRVGLYDIGRMDFAEGPYTEFLKYRGAVVLREAELVAALEREELDFLLTRAKNDNQIFSLRRPLQYRTIAPFGTRYRTLAAFSFSDEVALPGFQTNKQIFDFGSRDLKVIGGMREADSLNGLPVRWGEGKTATIAVEGSIMLHERGAKAFLNCTLNPNLNPKGTELHISVNGIRVHTIKALSRNMKTYEFAIPPGVLHQYDNTLAFETALSAQTEVARPVLYNWLSLRIR